MDSFSKRGWWWLPANSQSRVRGTLTFSRSQGLALVTDIDVSGALSGESDLVLGRFDGGQRVSLLRCLKTSSSLSLLDGASTYTLKPHLAYVGVHVLPEEDFRFDELHVKYSGLFEWLGFHTIDWKPPSKESPSTRFQITELVHQVGECTVPTGSLVLRATNDSSMSNTEAHFVGGAVISIRSTSPRTYLEFSRDFVRPLQDFLCLVTDQSISILSVTGTVGFESDDVDAPQDAEIDIYFEPIFYADSVNVNHSLFYYSDIKDQWCDVITRWLRVHNELNSLMRFYFGIRYRPMYVEQKFINNVFSLEAYHRIRYQGVGSPAKQAEERVSAILTLAETLGEDDQEWLKNKIAYPDEPNLRERLADITGQASPVAEVLFPSNRKRNRFVGRVVRIRNGFAHLGSTQDDDNDVTRRPDLYQISEQLSWILKCCLLHEIGLSTEFIRDKISHHQALNFLADTVENR